MIRTNTLVSRVGAAVAFAALQQLATEPVEAVKRRAFVTSETGNGNLNSWPEAGGLFGLDAGDQICQELADNAGLPNASSYRAWLSTATTDAYCHIQGQTGKKGSCVGTAVPAGPWYRYDGVGRFTGTLDELTGGEQRIYQPIRYDENGGDLSENVLGYWTGTDSAGEVYVDNCGSWVVGTAGLQGITGSQTRTTGDWTTLYTDSCDDSRRLLCLETGASEVTPVPWVPAALAFVTSAVGAGDLGDWPEAGNAVGLGAGDAICRNLAAAAHLPSPSSFFAWISGTTVDARDRMTLAGVPIRRVDGFRIADSKADLLANDNDNTLHVDEWGRYLTEKLSYRTSTYSNGTRRDDTTCLDWTSGSSAEAAMYGTSNVAYDELWTYDFYANCGPDARLLCFSNREVLFWDGFDLSGNTERWSSVTP
jgi:hypothetical protein